MHIYPIDDESGPTIIGSVGFTGTQQGMTEAQKRVLRECLWRLRQLGYRFFHHGDCIGADAEAHEIAVTLGYMIVLHPPCIETKRAFCDSDFYFQERPYLERNHRIVDRTRRMVAAPKESEEVRRSGTWATIRYALKIGKRVTVIKPDGVGWTKIKFFWDGLTTDTSL